MSFKFEISIRGEAWQVIPEQIFYDSLYRHANRLTPLIKNMLNGMVAVYGNTQYRIIATEHEKKKDEITPT